MATASNHGISAAIAEPHWLIQKNLALQMIKRSIFIGIVLIYPNLCQRIGKNLFPVAWINPTFVQDALSAELRKTVAKKEPDEHQLSLRTILHPEEKLYSILETQEAEDHITLCRECQRKYKVATKKNWWDYKR